MNRGFGFSGVNRLLVGPVLLLAVLLLLMAALAACGGDFVGFTRGPGDDATGKFRAGDEPGKLDE